MFFELQNKVGFSAIVETGTFQGITTEFLHKTSRLPTYTAEIHPKYYGYSKTRFLLNNKIKVFFGNSTDFLKSLLKNPEFIQKKLFLKMMHCNFLPQQ